MMRKLFALVLVVLCEIALGQEDYAIANSGVITVGGQNVGEAFRRMVELLNSPVDGSWVNLMADIVTHGSMDAKVVSFDNYEGYINSWPIIGALRNQVLEAARILVLASDSSYKAEHLVINTGGYLANAVVVSRLDPSTGAVTLGYLMVESSCNIRQQTQALHYRHCWKCAKKLWLGNCCEDRCCRHEPRGLTPNEVTVITNRLRSDQHTFANNLRNLRTYSELPFFEDGVLAVNKNSRNAGNNMHKSMVKFTRDIDVQEEIMGSDDSSNSSFIKELQSKLQSLDKTYELFTLKKVNSRNLKTVLTMLGNKYKFTFNYTEVETKLETDNFILEKCFSTENEVSYTMIVTVKNETSYDITATHSRSQFEYVPPLNVTIVSSTENDNFAEVEEIKDNSSKSLGSRILRAIILTFRWFGVKKILGNVSPAVEPVFMPLAVQELTIRDMLESERDSPYFVEGLVALGTALTAVSQAWSAIAGAFKTKSSTQFEHIKRLGFNHFHLDSKVLWLKGFQNDKLDTFADYIFKRFNVPSSLEVTRDDIVMMGFAEDGSVWDQMRILFNKDSTGRCNHLQILNNPITNTHKANWAITSFNSDLLIAPDVLVKTTSKSILGGIFESEKTEFLTTPHVLTPDEIQLIQKFLEIVAYGRLATEIGIKLKWPDVK